MRLNLLAVMLVISALAGCQSNGKKSPTQNEAALKQWNQARASVLATLAKSQYESGNLDKSQQTLGEALRLQPDNANLHVLAGKIAIEQGQLDQAEREMTLARKLDDKNAEAEYLSGVVYQRWQKPELAYECYLRASQKNPSELAYILARAEMLVAMNCANEALTLLKSKVESFEHHAELHHEIGQLLVEQKDYAGAISSLRQANILAPDDLIIKEHLGMAYFHNHQYIQAGDAFKRLVQVDPSSKRFDLWIALGECQMQAGRIPDARTSFDKATQLNPASTAAWLSFAKSELQLGDLRRAESILRKTLSSDTNCAEAHLMLGYVRLRQNHMDDALAEFTKASSLDRSDAVSLSMMGYVLEKTGKPLQARKYYALALKIKPDDELAARLMASVDVND